MSESESTPPVASSTHRLPGPLLRALGELRDYCQDYLGDQLDGRRLPLAFWRVDDDDVYFQVLGFLPLFAPPDTATDDTLPEGFRLAFAIFALADDFQVNGWTALRNQAALLPQTIAAYRRIGMREEAAALERAQTAMQAHPRDPQAWETAYRTGTNPYAEDDERELALYEFFTANRALFV